MQPQTERRRTTRRLVNFEGLFRVLWRGCHIREMRLTSAAPIHIVDLGVGGLGFRSGVMTPDGVHLDRLRPAHQKPRLYLQWKLPGEIDVNIVGETVWCEQVTSEGHRLFQVGLRIVESDSDAEQAIRTFFGKTKT